MRIGTGHGRTLVGIALVGAVWVGTAEGCGRAERAPSDGQQGGGDPHRAAAAQPDSLQPPRMAEDVNRTSRDSLLRYARQLRFDTIPGTGDRQRLTGAAARVAYAPLAWIQPQVASASYELGELRGGRIIARIISEDTVRYAPLNLAPRDTVYWWVDSTSTGWRSVYIPSNASDTLITRRVALEKHADGSFKQSLARFTETAQYAGTWGSCGWAYCCDDAEAKFQVISR